MSENFVQMVVPKGVTHAMEHQGYAVIADYTGIEVDERQFEGAHQDNYGKVGWSIPIRIPELPFCIATPAFCIFRRPTSPNFILRPSGFLSFFLEWVVRFRG